MKSLKPLGGCEARCCGAGGRLSRAGGRRSRSWAVNRDVCWTDRLYQAPPASLGEVITCFSCVSTPNTRAHLSRVQMDFGLSFFIMSGMFGCALESMLYFWAAISLTPLDQISVSAAVADLSNHLLTIYAQISTTDCLFIHCLELLLCMYNIHFLLLLVYSNAGVTFCHGKYKWYKLLEQSAGI